MRTIELGGVVRTCSVGVERQVGQPWEQQSARFAEIMLDGRGELAAEENRAAGIDVQQHVSSFPEINGLHEPSVQPLGLSEMGIELSTALDLDHASSHDAAFCQASRSGINH